MPRAVFALSVLVLTLPTIAVGQHAPGEMSPPGGQGSSNVHVMSHVALGRVFTVGDIEVEQELSRPYSYVPRLDGSNHSAGLNIISLKDPHNAKSIWYWRIEQPEVHQGAGALQDKYFKLKDRYYNALSVQFSSGGPDNDLGAIVWDVTGLPDTTKIKEAGRIRAKATLGGFHNIYNYKHSDGRVLMFATVSAPQANIYDMEKFLGGDANQGLVGAVPVGAPPSTGGGMRGYHDFYVGYDPATHQDKFYGAGVGGYYVYDVTNTSAPKLLVSVTGVAGVTFGHTFTPSPDGRYAVSETEYMYAPLRIFDLKPALDGQVQTISRPIGAWTSDWTTNPHNHEVRWPYVFVSAYEEGLQIFNMMDPTNPYTVGYYDTYDGPHRMGRAPSGDPEQRWNDRTYPIIPASEVVNGAFGIDVRNADGLIVISDLATGFWAFKMDGFDGWNGHQWGMPNVSSAQDYDNGPDGAPKPSRVSVATPTPGVSPGS